MLINSCSVVNIVLSKKVCVCDDMKFKPFSWINVQQQYLGLLSILYDIRMKVYKNIKHKPSSSTVLQLSKCLNARYCKRHIKHKPCSTTLPLDVSTIFDVRRYI